MILIEQGAINPITVTTTEIGSADWYLFEFTCEATLVSVYCIGVDTSPFQDRYNQFSIREMVGGDPLDSEIEMKPTGQWYYRIYANTNATNLDPDGLTLLERGMCIVSGDATAPVMPTFTDGNVTAAVYEP